MIVSLNTGDKVSCDVSFMFVFEAILELGQVASTKNTLQTANYVLLNAFCSCFFISYQLYLFTCNIRGHLLCNVFLVYFQNQLTVPVPKVKTDRAQSYPYWSKCSDIRKCLPSFQAQRIARKISFFGALLFLRNPSKYLVHTMFFSKNVLFLLK